MKYNSIFIQNIYYMLSYAFRTLDQEQDETIAGEKFDNIHSLFAAILSSGIGRLLKQGLHREYRTCGESTSNPRGRITMPGTIRNLVARRRVLTCEYDELSENILFNQILKATALLLLRSEDVAPRYRDELKRELLFFSAVELPDLTGIRWSSLRYHRNNSTYRLLINLCHLILEGMLLTTESGDYRLASFVDDQRLHHLYEKFILEYYRKEWPQVTAEAAQIPWALDEGSGTMLPVMQSDIMLTRGNTVLIIDAKYYSHILQTNFSAETIRSAHLYQIFTYVKNRDAQFRDAPHTVSGMLLYAATEEAIQPDCSYLISGNRISVRTLDLNCEFSNIAAQLDAIVGTHFGLTEPQQ